MSWLLVHTKYFENFEDVRPAEAFRLSQVPKFSVFDETSRQVTTASAAVIVALVVRLRKAEFRHKVSLFVSVFLPFMKYLCTYVHSLSENL